MLSSLHKIKIKIEIGFKVVSHNGLPAPPILNQILGM